MVKSLDKPLTVHSKPLMSPLQRYIISTSVHTMIVQRHLLAAKTACTSRQNVDCTVQLHKKGVLQLNNMPTTAGHPWLLAHWLDKKCIMMHPHKHYVRQLLNSISVGIQFSTHRAIRVINHIPSSMLAMYLGLYFIQYPIHTLVNMVPRLLGAIVVRAPHHS